MFEIVFSSRLCGENKLNFQSSYFCPIFTIKVSSIMIGSTLAQAHTLATDIRGNRARNLPAHVIIIKSYVSQHRNSCANYVICYL